MSQHGQPDPRLGDQFEYLQLGRNLLSSHELKFHDDRFDQDVYAYRTPGYPLLIAVCGGSVRAVRVVHAILDTSTVLAIYLLARRFLDRGPSFWAAGLVAVNPFLIYFTGLILSETLFACMLAWGMCLLARPRPIIAVTGMLVLALSVQVRPSAVGLVVLLAGAAAWNQGWHRVIRSTAIAAALVLAALLPWAERNAHHPQLRAWIWTTTNGGVTLYDGFHDGATGASDQKAFLDSLKPTLWRLDEVQRDQYLAQAAHEWIAAHPGRALALAGSKVARTWSPIPLSSEYGRDARYVAVGLIYSLPFDVLFLIGLWKAVLPRTAKVLLVLPAIYFTGIHALSVGSLRYRIPVEPPMAVIAGAALSAACSRFLHGPSRRKSG
jgi:4-amino-4-deoxy-L-arabinose transferase-like glycosyltransferase